MEEARNDGRLASLDALRGLDMLMIAALPPLLAALIGGVFGCGDCWFLKSVGRHANWAGFNIRDTIFPLFMFISGVAYPYSYAKRVERGDSTRSILLKILWRTLALVLLGIVYGGFFTTVFAKGFAAVRYPSVLARIGIAWGAAACLYVFCRRRTRIAVAAAILVGYWAILYFVAAPGSAPGVDTFSPDGCFACWLDRHIWPNGSADPEGFLSTFPAIVTTMGGVFAGELVRSERFSGGRKTLILLGASLACGLAAWAWSPWCPIVKKLWTSTFVLAAWSYSLAFFALFYWLVDVMMWRRWTFFFRVVGMNSILIYFLQKKDLIDFHVPAKFFFHGFASWVGGPWTGVIDAVAYLLMLWLVLFLFYKKKVFLRV